ncbi:MAG: phage tail protein [Sulfitobacter sp.]
MAIFSAAVVALGTWFTGLTVGAQLLVQLAGGLAFNALSAALAGRAEQPKEPGIVGELQQGADITRSFLVGRRATAGSLAYHNQWGGSENEFYTRITALSDLPITGLVDLWIDGQHYQIDRENPHDEYGWPILGLSETRTENNYIVVGTNPEFGTDEYGVEEVEVTEPFGWIKFFDGTQAVGDEFVATKVATEERPWSSDDYGDGIAYAITTFKLNRQLFQGLPEVLFVCDGIAMLDVSSDITGFSQNPLVAAHQLISGLSYGGEWFYGPESSGRVNSVEQAVELVKCDEPVPGGDAMSEEDRIAIFGSATVPARYRASLEVQVNRPVADVLEDLMSACNGRISEVGTRYRMQVGDPGIAAMLLSDDDISSFDAQSFAPFFPLAETVNAVTATYPSPADGWQMQDAPPLYRPDLEQEDGNRRLPTGVQLVAVPFPEQVQRLQSSALAEARRARRHSVVLPPKFFVLEPGDFVEWTSQRNGYIGKLFRVDGISDLSNGDVSVDFTEVDPADYDWTAVSDFRPVTSGSLSAVAPGVLTVSGWDVAPLAVRGDEDGMEVPALALTWTAPAVGAVNGLEWQVRRKADLSLVADGVAADVSLGLTMVFDGILANSSYEARGRFISPRASSWTEWKEALAPNALLGPAAFADPVWDRIAAEAQASKDEADAAFQLALDERDAISIDDILSRIIEEARVDTEFEVVREELSVGLDGANAAIEQVQTVAVTATQAIAQLSTSLNVSIDAVETELTQTADALATLETSFASYRTLITSQFNDLDGFVDSQIYTKSEADLQISSQVNTVQSNVDGLSATVTQVQTAQNGVLSQYAVSLNANGAVGGISLLAGGGETNFNVDVNAFRVGNTNDAGSYLPVLQILSGQIYLSNAKVRTAQIQDLNVTTLKIAGNSVTAPVEAVGGNAVGNGNFAQACSAFVNIQAGEVADVVVSWRFQQGYASFPGPTWGYRIRANGTTWDVRDGMTAANDYPSGQFTIKNRTGAQTIALDWIGSNGDISRIPRLEVRVVYR